MDLLADRPSQRLGLGRGKARQLLGDLHVLLLIYADPLGVARDRLQALVDERDGLAAVLPRCVARDVLHRARPIQGDERDQVLELGRLHLAQRIAHPGRLELEDTRRIRPGQHLVRLPVVDRDRADVEPVADQADRLVDHVEVAEPEEVHLEQAERLDVLHRDLRHDLLVRALLLQRHDVDQRLGADHDPSGVDRVRPGQALERPGQVDDLPGDGIVPDGVRQLGSRLQRLLERLPGSFRDQLREPVDGAVRNLEHPTGVTHGGPRGHRRERDDLGHSVPAVLLRDVVDHPLAALDGKVDVHVGHVLARRVEEPLEEQPVAHRVDVRDPEAVRRKRACGAAATGTDRDAVALREADEVGDDQEVVGKAHLAHRLELELQALDQLGRHPVVALGEAGLAQLDEVVERIAVAGRRELRQQDSAQLDLDVAAVGDLERATHRILVPGEVERHFLRGLEVELVRPELPVIGVLQRVARLDAEQRLVRVRVRCVEVVDVARRNERQAALGGEPRQRLEDRLLDVEVPVLELDVRVVATEDLLQPVELHLGVAHPGVDDRLGDTAREAAGERDQARRVLLEQRPVDPGPVVVALEITE